MTLKPVKASKGGTNKTAGLACIIHYHKNKSDSETEALTGTNFQNIKDAIKVQHSQRSVSERLPDRCSHAPDVCLSHSYGYHRKCYKIHKHIQAVNEETSFVKKTLQILLKDARPHNYATRIFHYMLLNVFCGNNRIT